MDDPYLIIKINGKNYRMIDLIDKSIYTKKNTLLYRYVNDPASAAKFQVKPESLLGKLYSWQRTPDGTIWLMFYTSNLEIKKAYTGGFFFVKSTDVSDDTLKDQGTKTAAEIQKEKEQAAKDEKEAEKSIPQKIIEGALKLGAVYVGGSLLIKAFTSGSNK